MKLSEIMREDICGTAAIYVEKVAQLEEENWALRELCIQLRGLADEQIDALLTDTQESG